MDMTTLIGILGGVILVGGAAYPDRANVRPITSMKDWLFFSGGVIMLIYSIVGYVAGGSIFFLFLEALVNLAGILMMLEASERMTTPAISVAAIGLIIWSFVLFPDSVTFLFVLGLAGISMGYCFPGGTMRREVALMLGSALIAFFSFLEASWIFCWLNLFFAAFSMMQVVRMRHAGNGI